MASINRRRFPGVRPSSTSSATTTSHSPRVSLIVWFSSSNSSVKPLAGRKSAGFPYAWLSGRKSSRFTRARLSPPMVRPSNASSITSLSPSRLSLIAKSSRTAPNSKPLGGRKSTRSLNSKPRAGRESARFPINIRTSIGAPSQTVLSRMCSSVTSLGAWFSRTVPSRTSPTSSRQSHSKFLFFSDDPQGARRGIGRKSMPTTKTTPSSIGKPLRGTQPSTAKNESSAADDSTAKNESSAAVKSSVRGPGAQRTKRPSSSRTIGLRREREITGYHG